MKTIILTILIANALFWGLFPHSAHCLFIKNVNKILDLNIKCPEHKIHLFIGILFYIASVYYAQRDTYEFKRLMTR